LDFEFANPVGMFVEDVAEPMVQIAFAYTAVRYIRPDGRLKTPKPGSSKGNSAPGSNRGTPTGSRQGTPRTPSGVKALVKALQRIEMDEGKLAPVTIRRLRVITVQTDFATSPNELYRLADMQAVVATMMYKVVRECQLTSVLEARILLSDWLVNFYSCLFQVMRIEQPTLMPTVDMLNEDDQFGVILRAVYGMLHMDLLNPSDVSDDRRASCISSFIGIDPSCAQTAVYPELLAYELPCKRLARNLPLSRKSLITVGGQVFIIDAFWTLILYSALPRTGTSLSRDSTEQESEHSQQVDNEDDGQLEQQIAFLRKNTLERIKGRSIIPSITECSVGSKDAFFFDKYLYDDKELSDSKVCFDSFVLALVEQLKTILALNNS